MTDVQATLFMSVLLSRLNAPILECTCDSALCWEIAQRISAESTGHAEVYFAYCRGTGATVRRIASTRSVRKSGAATGTAVWCVTARHFRPVFLGSYASRVTHPGHVTTLVKHDELADGVVLSCEAFLLERS